MKTIFFILAFVAVASRVEAKKKCSPVVVTLPNQPPVTAPPLPPATQPPQQVCTKKYESYSDCGSACPLNCDNPTGEGIACTLQCVQGCFCDAGYVRDKKGNCVQPIECPKPICTKRNEVYSQCGSNPCEATCDQPNRPQLCKAACRPGCGCKEGYLRDPSGNCVLPRQCPPKPVCKKNNESYQECGPTEDCEIRCDRPTGGFACPKECVKGCFCDSGYVRDSKGNCILKKDCPAPTPTCDKKKHEVYSQCGANGCQATCANPDLPKVCRAVCTPGCICEEGYIRDANKNCILLKNCPTTQPTCKKNNEVYQDCGTACPRTCDNFNEAAIICTKQCVKGCFCAAGYVRNSSGNCVLPQSCPKKLNCGSNENYVACTTICGEKTCFSRIDRYCGLGCQAKCLCKEGYVRDPNERCVAVKDCPVE